MCLDKISTINRSQSIAGTRLNSQTLADDQYEVVDVVECAGRGFNSFAVQVHALVAVAGQRPLTMVLQQLGQLSV